MYFSLECCARDRERSLISRVCARWIPDSAEANLGNYNDKDLTPRVPGMRKKIKKRFLIWVRMIKKIAQKWPYGDLEKDGAVRKKQWTRSFYLDALVTCCFPHCVTFLCTFPVYSWHWGKSNRSICIDVNRRKGTANKGASIVDLDMTTREWASLSENAEKQVRSKSLCRNDLNFKANVEERHMTKMMLEKRLIGDCTVH